MNSMVIKSESDALEKLNFGGKKQLQVAIMALEAYAKEQPQVDVDVEQLTHAGMYVRAATAKAGTLLTGAIYKYDHIEIMTSGVLITTTDDGTAKRLEGFNLMSAPSGKKRAAYIVEDTTWITIHQVGNTQNLSGDDIQDAITVETFEELSGFYNQANQIDYMLFLGELGIDPAVVQAEAERTDDYSDAIHIGELGVSIGDSNIQGSGLFAEKNFNAGDTIMPARLDGIRTQAGRYINHAIRPNAKFVFVDGDLMCVAIDEINPLDEITVNYRYVLQDRAIEGDLCQE